MDVLLPLIAQLKARTGWQISPGAVELVLAIVLALVAIAILAWALRTLWSKLKAFAKLPKVPPLCGCAPAAELPKAGWLSRASLAFDYLRTRREWRYESPWFLLLGQQQGGKSSLLASVGAEHRQALSQRQQSLHIDGASWHAIGSGLLLDPPGRLPFAAANAALGGALASADESAPQQWQQLLDQLDSLRPERALDGIVLVLSASTLLEQHPANLQAAAQNARQQLRMIEERFEFALPVYVVLTACDQIEGFAAFWRSQLPQRRLEMVGWSAPQQTTDSPPAQWGATVFDDIGQQLRALQVEAAAHCERIAPTDADALFLYPRHFGQLQQAFQQWLAIVFQASAWQTSFFLRGVYCTGSVDQTPALRSDDVRENVAFVEDLLTQKILPETHLGRPTRAGVWSRNRVIRRMQWLGIALLSALLLAGGIRTWQLDQQIEAVVSALKLMQQLQNPVSADSACIRQEPVYQLIGQVSRIDSAAQSWLLPLSLLDDRLRERSARRVADNAFRKVILPGLACQLSQRAFALSRQANTDSGANLDYSQSQVQLQQFVQQAVAYEQNASRFQRLLGKTPFAKDPVLLAEFLSLVEYAYGTPLAAHIRTTPGLLPATLGQLSTQDFSHGINTPLQLKQDVGAHLLRQATQLRQLMGSQLQAGTQLLLQLEQKQQAILPHVQQFSSWLNWIRSAWLGSTSASNPIQKVQSELAASLQPLVLSFGYPADLLANASAQFDAAQQYPLAMQSLKGMSLPGYGSLFVEQDGQIIFNPALQDELLGLNALSGLDYMQINPLRSFACQGKLADWSASALTAATQYAASYTKFIGQPLLKNGRPDALYRQLARYQLELAMNNNLQLAQAAAGETAASAGSNLSSEARQSRNSSNFGKIAPTLLTLQKQFRSFGMDGSATRLEQCARQYGNDQLSQIALLAEQSQLYQPSFLPASADPDAHFFDLGSTPVIKDMLARQISRVQILSDYAAPVLDYLNQATPSVPDAAANTSNAPYWNNTATELKNFAQAKDPNAQAALLENLFLKEFPGLQNSNCNQTLSAYQSPALGNDLFSSHRQQLEKSVQMRCKGERYAQAQSAYQVWSARFNRELAGRYPFGTLDADDASLNTAKAFFSDYASQRAALGKLVASLDDPYWVEVRRFLAQLDDVNQFLQGNLVPADGTAAADAVPQLTLNVNFRAQASIAVGSDQISHMSLESGARDISFPNGGSSLDWQYGQPLVLDLSWASLSLWRPAMSASSGDLQVEGSTASFAASGNWAVLRLIDRHPPKSGGKYDQQVPPRLLLEFDVPILNTSGPGQAISDTARVFLSLRPTNLNAKPGASLKLPAVFPRVAPQ